MVWWILAKAFGVLSMGIMLKAFYVYLKVNGRLIRQGMVEIQNLLMQIMFSEKSNTSLQCGCAN